MRDIHFIIKTLAIKLRVSLRAKAKLECVGANFFLACKRLLLKAFALVGVAAAACNRTNKVTLIKAIRPKTGRRREACRFSGSS